MTPQKLVEEFRNQVRDTEQPYLWSDDEVLRFLTDAQDMFVRETGGISDMSTAAICDLPVTLNTPFTAHSPYILRIMSGRLLTSKRDISFISEGDVDMLKLEDYGSQIHFSLDDTDVGEVRYGILGLEENKIRWLKVPEITETCKIRVYRLPYPRLPTEWTSIESETLEIDEHHHIHLIKWMKHLAYTKQDAEARNDKQAQENEAAFMAYCRKAKNEVERRRYKPRFVRYGGV